jgi:hypothetical protein
MKYARNFYHGMFIDRVNSSYTENRNEVNLAKYNISKVLNLVACPTFLWYSNSPGHEPLEQSSFSYSLLWVSRPSRLFYIAVSTNNKR